MLTDPKIHFFYIFNLKTFSLFIFYRLNFANKQKNNFNFFKLSFWNKKNSKSVYFKNNHFLFNYYFKFLFFYVFLNIKIKNFYSNFAIILYPNIARPNNCVETFSRLYFQFISFITFKKLHFLFIGNYGKCFTNFVRFELATLNNKKIFFFKNKKKVSSLFSTTNKLLL